MLTWIKMVTVRKERSGWIPENLGGGNNHSSWKLRKKEKQS